MQPAVMADNPEIGRTIRAAGIDTNYHDAGDGRAPAGGRLPGRGAARRAAAARLTRHAGAPDQALTAARP